MSERFMKKNSFNQRDETYQVFPNGMPAAKNQLGGVLNIHFLQNAYYYLSATYKFFEKQAFSFQFLLLKKQIEIRFLSASRRIEMTTMFGQGLGRGKADAKRPLFPSQSPCQGLCHFDGSAIWRRLRNLFYDNVFKNN